MSEGTSLLAVYEPKSFSKAALFFLKLLHDKPRKQKWTFEELIKRVQYVFPKYNLIENGNFRVIRVGHKEWLYYEIVDMHGLTTTVNVGINTFIKHGDLRRIYFLQKLNLFNDNSLFKVKEIVDSNYRYISKEKLLKYFDE